MEMWRNFVWGSKSCLGVWVMLEGVVSQSSSKPFYGS